MVNIVKIRKERGITQSQLADSLGIDRSAVAKWETGKAMPRGETLIKLSTVLGCSIDELLK